MKKFVSLITFLSLFSISFAQFPIPVIDLNADSTLNDYSINKKNQNTWDGYTFNPIGNYRALNLLVNIVYDVSNNDPQPGFSGVDWPQARITDVGINTIVPNWAQDSSLFDIHFNQGNNITGIFTRRFYESSFGSLHITGDYVVITLPQSYIVQNNPLPQGQFTQFTLMDRVIDYLNEHGGIQAYWENNLIEDYDSNNNDTIDLTNIIVRNSFSTSSLDYGHFIENNGTAGSNLFRGILFNTGEYYQTKEFTLQCVGNGRQIAEDPLSVLFHEFAHKLYGSNDMHSAGGNGWNYNSGRTFLQRMGGYGLMGQSGTGMVSANGFDRWWLHWKSPIYNTTNSYIAASNQASDITKENGTKTFILRDFVTTGDAIRIKLPYTDTDAKAQYIWLENHKIGTNNKLDFLTNSTSLCRPEGKAGIYAFYQVGKDVLTGDNIRPQGESDHLKFISAEGNFNYMKLTDEISECFRYTTDNGHGKKLDPNPLMGDNDIMIHFYNDSLNLLKVDSNCVFKLDIKDHYINGQWVVNDSMPYLMDERDPFRGTKTFNLSSNPAPVNTTTFYNTNDNEGNITSTATPAGLVNNNTIYITGLSITMTKLTNGDYSVNIDWGHNRLDNSVAWTGKIALKESLYVYDNDTLLLKQNKTPIKIARDTFTGQFAPYTAFECLDKSEMYLSNNSRTILTEKSKFYILSGSTVTVQTNAKLIVKSGCELIIEGCGNLVLRENGQLVVESGGILTIKEGANVFMDGLNNLNLQLGFETGTDGISLSGDVLDILDVPPVKQITSNTTWTGKSYKFFDDLYISAGATLNLNGTTLKFFRNAKAKVARGAKLNMTNNSKLTTTCTSELWQGVEVWGNPGIAQSPTTNQGYLVMNNSTIECAREGVLLDRPMPVRVPGVPSGNGGGIIQAVNSTFKNNYIGVSFSSYPNDNVSTFSNCLFTANNQFPELKTGVDCHVNMNGITGVDFKKCTFNFIAQIFGGSVNNIVGIRSLNSNFTVDGLPLNGKFQRSVFENLKYGVYAAASLSSRNFTVRNSVFRSCKSGIFGSGINSSRITENRFLQPKYISQSNFTQFAIFLEYCNNYTIQEDTLVGMDSQFKSEAGILIRNSGPSENLLYNNKLENFYSGIIAEGENRGTSGTGLCIKCNDFSGNQTDINIIPRDGIPISSQGIKHDQGSIQDTITAPAGNYFSTPSTSIININNEFAQPIEYFYHRFPINPRLQPERQNVVLIDNTVFLTVGTDIEYNKPGACPSKLNINQSKEELIASSMNTNDEISETQSQLVTLTDDGDTPLLVNSITSSAPFEALLLHDELMNTSPYLSDTALIEAGKKEEVLNSALVRDIMVANPHSAKSPEVISALEQRAEQLPEELMDEIKAGAELISARQALELTKSSLEADLAERRSGLLQVYQKEYNFDSLRWALTTFPEPLSAYQEAWTWFDQGDSNNGITALQNLEIESLPVHHQINQPGYVQLAGIFNLISTDTTYVFTEDTVSIDALFDLSIENNTAGVSARNLLAAYRLLDYEPSVTLPDTGLKVAPVLNKPKIQGKLLQEALHVFPNPASDYVVIAYQLEKEGELSIVSQEGRIVYTQSIAPGKNQIIIRVNHLASGVYIARMAEGKIVHSAKFTVK